MYLNVQTNTSLPHISITYLFPVWLAGMTVVQNRAVVPTGTIINISQLYFSERFIADTLAIEYARLVPIKRRQTAIYFMRITSTRESERLINIQCERKNAYASVIAFSCDAQCRDCIE